MPSRSRRLASGRAAAAAVITIYTVPAGQRVVVRSLHTFFSTIVNRTIRYEAPPLGAPVVLTYVSAGATLDTESRVWHVLESGDTLQLRSTGAAFTPLEFVTYHVSGVLLDN